MKFLGMAVVVGLAAVACQLGPAGNPANPPPDIIIASDLSTSAFGLEARPAEEAIAYAIRQQGSIDGFTLGYLPLDDSLAATPNPIRGAQNVERMIRTGAVLGMVGPYNSSVAYDEIPIANGAPLAMVSPSASSRCLTEASWSCGKRTTSLRPTGRNNFFRIEAADPLEGRGMGRYVVDVLKLSRIAVLNEWDYLGDLTVQEFQRELAVGNARVVLNQRLDSTTTSFAPFLEAADAAGAQAVYAIGDSTDAPFCMIARQMKEITPGMVLLGTDGIATDPQCVSDAGASNAEGVLGTFIDVDPRQSTDPGVRSIVDAYVRTHPDVSFFTFAAYDCARILIAAIDRAIKAAGGNIPTRQQVIEAVAQTNYHGLTGDYTFDANGDATSPLMSMWQVRNGVWTYVEKLDVSAS